MLWFRKPAEKCCTHENILDSQKGKWTREHLLFTYSFGSIIYSNISNLFNEIKHEINFQIFLQNITKGFFFMIITNTSRKLTEKIFQT